MCISINMCNNNEENCKKYSCNDSQFNFTSRVNMSRKNVIYSLSTNISTHVIYKFTFSLHSFLPFRVDSVKNTLLTGIIDPLQSDVSATADHLDGSTQCLASAEGELADLSFFLLCSFLLCWLWVRQREVSYAHSWQIIDTEVRRRFLCPLLLRNREHFWETLKTDSLAMREVNQVDTTNAHWSPQAREFCLPRAACVFFKSVKCSRWVRELKT